MRSRPIGGEIRRIWPGHISDDSVTKLRLGRVNPGCGHVGSVTRSCPVVPLESTTAPMSLLRLI